MAALAADFDSLGANPRRRVFVNRLLRRTHQPR
jgi:hypothetical protein